MHDQVGGIRRGHCQVAAECGSELRAPPAGCHFCKWRGTCCTKFIETAAASLRSVTGEASLACPA